MDHFHLLINAGCGKPLHSEAAGINFIRDLVAQIDMEFLAPPMAKYCTLPGNRGLTAFGLITTSHVALHTWDEAAPGTLQLDVYSCKSFDVDRVVAFVEDRLEAFNISLMFLDRGAGFRFIDSDDLRRMPRVAERVTANA